MRYARLLAATSLASLVAFTPVETRRTGLEHRYTHLCTLVVEPGNAFTFVRPPARPLVKDGEFAVTPTPIAVTYVSFESFPQAQAAFQHAVDIWASLVTSPIPMNVRAEFKNLGTGILGSAGSAQLWRDFPGTPMAGTWYGDVLADKFTNSDLGGGFDINANFNSSYANWYFGTDGLTPVGKIDFVSVVLHELGHGLGFFGAASVSSGTGTLGLWGYPTIYDRFTLTETNVPMLGFVSPSSELGTQLTRAYNGADPHGPGVYWGGTNGVAGNGGVTARLYTPATWAPGSSYSHLDDSVFLPGNANSLMTHAISSAEAIHHPGPIALGMFQDMGWTLQSAVPPLPDFRDFNADGKPDLLFEHSNGARYAWFMDGATFSSGSFLAPNPMDPNYTIAGVSDFTGDGKPDLLMQNTADGRVTLYHMNGVNYAASQTIQSAANTPWKIVATGDFNADGKPDIVWENFNTGQIYIWFMSSSGGAAIYAGAGGAFAGNFIRDGASAIISLGATTMRVMGAVDMDADGDTDLVWQDQTTGALRVWYLNGITRTADLPATPSAVNPVWKIKTVGDYNADGRADFIFQHATTGALYAWFMNGASLATGGYLTPSAVNPVWQLVGPR